MLEELRVIVRVLGKLYLFEYQRMTECQWSEVWHCVENKKSFSLTLFTFSSLNIYVFG